MDVHLHINAAVVLFFTHCTFMCSLFMVGQKGWGVFGDSKECARLQQKPDHHPMVWTNPL